MFSHLKGTYYETSTLIGLVCVNVAVWDVYQPTQTVFFNDSCNELIVLRCWFVRITQKHHVEP